MTNLIIHDPLHPLAEAVLNRVWDWTPQAWLAQQLAARGAVTDELHVYCDDARIRDWWYDPPTPLPTYGLFVHPNMLMFNEAFLGPESTYGEAAMQVWITHEIQHLDPSGERQFLTDEEDARVAYDGRVGEGEETMVGYLFGQEASRTLWDVAHPDWRPLVAKALTYLRDYGWGGPPALWSLWWPSGFSAVGTIPKTGTPWAPFAYREGMTYAELATHLPAHFFINVGGSWSCYGPDLPAALMDDRPITYGNVCWRPAWPWD